ncbi:MAG: hypothetical protein ACYS8Z_06725 [Planctomycetota bacterium]|jgi:hypothetical protein
MQICGSKTCWLTVLAVFALITQSASGRIIYVDDDGEISGDGSSWENAYPCLQNALESAQYGDEICLAQGTYKPDRKVGLGCRGTCWTLLASGDPNASFHLVDGVAIRGGYAGLPSSLTPGPLLRCCIKKPQRQSWFQPDR